jgi:fatty-acyl-CoA synthase
LRTAQRLVTTVAKLLLARAADDAPALLFGERRWSYRELVDEGRRRAALFASLRRPGRPPHVGVLLDNVPDYLFWLTGAALSGAAIVGINSTYRGAQLAQLIEHTDCELLVTSGSHAPLLEGAGEPVPPERLLFIDRADYAQRLDAAPRRDLDAAAVPEDALFLLIFTSGSTGMPKAVRCTQGRIVRTSAHVVNLVGLKRGEDVIYAPLPFFHSSALFSGWATAITAGIPLATRAKFSASGFLPDVRRFGVTFLTYTGKLLNYVLATPPRPDDADNPLRYALGNEASVQDVKAFAQRFGCHVRDSYGSTEGLIIIRRDPSMPDGALGIGPDSVRVIDPESGLECPRARFDSAGKLLNLEEATGEIVETAPTSGFEGYYKNEEATKSRFRGGWFWSGDLAYRDAEGWFWFAGRSNEWLRVDSENFAAAPVEAIIGRHPDVRSVAVYAVPDEKLGDRVMAALELRDGAAFDSGAFDAFMRSQPDMGTKWLPSFMRVSNELPKLASLKLDKQRLRREAWRVDTVAWRPGKGDKLRPLSDEDRRRIDPLLG